LGSRTVTLLRRGYFTGRLNFEYKQPLSRLRENYILEEIEQDLLLDILRLRSHFEGGIYGYAAASNKQALDIPYKTLKTYSELTLPYLVTKDKMVKSASLGDTEYWRNFLVARQKEEKIKKELKAKLTTNE
jgi:hypothetical protein